VQLDASAQEIDVADPQGSRLAPRSPPTPRRSTSDRYRPDSSASLFSWLAVRYTLRRGGRFGNFTPRAGFDASSRSCAASSNIRASTE
jgi:hypothetical protein